ncbi:MAG: hypothetical protein WDN24_16600 [Sphingomonas sp.]
MAGHGTEGFDRSVERVGGVESVVHAIGSGPAVSISTAAAPSTASNGRATGRRNFRVILPHHPNFGESGDAGFASIGDYAAHYVRLFDAMGLERFHLRARRWAGCSRRNMPRAIRAGGQDGAGIARRAGRRRRGDARFRGADACRHARAARPRSCVPRALLAGGALARMAGAADARGSGGGAPSRGPPGRPTHACARSSPG